MILERHMMAFLLTAVEDLDEMARSMIVSLRAATKRSGTMVAMRDRARDWAASFLDLMSASMEWTMERQISSLDSLMSKPEWVKNYLMQCNRCTFRRTWSCWWDWKLPGSQSRLRSRGCGCRAVSRRTFCVGRRWVPFQWWTFTWFWPVPLRLVSILITYLCRPECQKWTRWALSCWYLL